MRRPCVPSKSWSTRPGDWKSRRGKLPCRRVGLVPQIEKLMEETNVTLAISLHAATEELRGRLMPVNRKYSLEQLIDCCRNLPLPRRKRITFEYVLLGGVNDSAARCAGLVPALTRRAEQGKRDSVQSPSRQRISPAPRRGGQTVSTSAFRSQDTSQYAPAARRRYRGSLRPTSRAGANVNLSVPLQPVAAN